MTAPVIIQVSTSVELDHVRELFVEYARSLDFHICFESFQSELNQLPGQYSPPGGCLLLALADGQPTGCVAIRPFDTTTAELKRLYVRPQLRGSGLGRRLADHAVEMARKAGYRHIRLDTLPSMTAARALYKSLGFVEVAGSVESGSETPVDMQLTL